MQYRPLGRSSLTVSSIALGSWLTYAGGIEQSQGIACIHAALDLGINFFDTANIYGRGAAESLLGDALQGIPRDRYVLATKLFYPMTEQDRGLSRAQVFKQLDASLTRLRTDHVDLYQCHEYDDEVPLEETLDALSQAVSQGKVRYIGFSNWTAEQVERAAQVTGVERFVSSQPQYSMLWRQPEADLFPTCKKHGISSVAYFRPEDSPLKENTLIYLIAHPSREAAKQNWAAFQKDPEWQKVAQESQVNGKIVAKVDSVFLDATDYSPMK